MTTLHLLYSEVLEIHGEEIRQQLYHRKYSEKFKFDMVRFSSRGDEGVAGIRMRGIWTRCLHVGIITYDGNGDRKK